MAKSAHQITQLDKYSTKLSLGHRRLYTVRCCGHLMEQWDVEALLPSESNPLGRSSITLGCCGCGREVQVQVVNGKPVRAVFEDTLAKEK